MGLCLRDAQRPAEAAASLLKAIRLAPTLFRAREELADLYGRLGKTDAWIAQLDTLRVLDPGPARDVALGLAYSKAGQSDRAVMTLRQAAESYPKHRRTYVALGRVWLEAAQARDDRIELSKAIEALEQAVAEEESSEALTLLGRALLLASESEAAERMLLQATARLPVDPLAFYYLADAAERRAHHAVARQALVNYLALAGDDDGRRRAALAVRVADLSMRVGDYPAAVTWYERALPALAADAAFIVKLADARLRVGQDDAARTALDTLLEKDPANAAARNVRRRIR
jgi:tetratricopeptide (TPR) repeat protein